MEARENTASNNRNSHKKGWPQRTPSSSQQEAPESMLFNEMNKQMSYFEGLQSKLQAKATEAVQDANIVSMMLVFIRQQIMSKQSTHYTEQVSPLFVPTPSGSPGFFPVTPLLSQRPHTRPKNA